MQGAVHIVYRCSGETDRGTVGIKQIDLLRFHYKQDPLKWIKPMDEPGREKQNQMGCIKKLEFYSHKSFYKGQQLFFYKVYRRIRWADEKTEYLLDPSGKPPPLSGHDWLGLPT